MSSLFSSTSSTSSTSFPFPPLFEVLVFFLYFLSLSPKFVAFMIIRFPLYCIRLLLFYFHDLLSFSFSKSCIPFFFLSLSPSSSSILLLSVPLSHSSLLCGWFELLVFLPVFFLLLVIPAGNSGSFPPSKQF
jgi:hypothetical protein